MQYIETIGMSLYSQFGVKHSVFIKDGVVVSYEMEKILGHGVFKIYNEEDYLKDKIVIYKTEVESFNIEKYEGRKYKGIVCFEALELIAKQNGVMLPIKKRVQTIARWSLALIVYSIIIYGGGIFTGYYGFTVSEQEYLLINY